MEQRIHGYKSVDGRVYNREKTGIRTVGGIGTGGPGGGLPSMIDIYKCEFYLTKGYRYTKSYIPKEAKAKIIQQYGLVFNSGMTRYVNTIDNVWAVLVAKFGPVLANRGIRSYDELVYRSKYR